MKKLAGLLVVAALALGQLACAERNDTFERTGRALDKAAAKTAKAVKKAAHKTGEALEKAGEAIQDKTAPATPPPPAK